MANRIPKLTRRAVEALKANGADTVYWDGELTGFGIRVRKSGRKNYVLQTRVRGKLRWYTIGQHGRITPDEARVAALEILAQAKMGIDPRDVDAKQKAEPVMTELGRRFLEEYVPTHCKPSTQGEYRRSVTLFIDPAIGEMRISEVARKDIAKLHFDLRDKPYQANRTLGVLSKMFSLAEVWGLRPDGSNPCRHVKRYKERKRERFLSPEETERLGEVLAEAEDEMPSAVAAFRLLLLTGCRLSEIQFLRWEYVKDDCIELPDAKTGGRVVPLGPEARALLADLPREEGNPWVIRGRAAWLPHHRSAEALAPHPRPCRVGGRTNSRPSPLICFEGAGFGRKPHDDREASGPYPGSDHCPICAPGPRFDPERRGPGHREHRRKSHPQAWLMILSHIAPIPCPNGTRPVVL